MNRAHVIRLNPTKEQEVYFRKSCGGARHAYNWALARWKEYRAKGERVKIKDLKCEYNKIKGEQFPWVYEVTKCAPEQAFSDLSQSFANYWRMKEEGTQPKLKHPRKDGEEGGFPHFKSKNGATSLVWQNTLGNRLLPCRLVVRLHLGRGGTSSGTERRWNRRDRPGLEDLGNLKLWREV
jgi:putative transposase